MNESNPTPQTPTDPATPDSPIPPAEREFAAFLSAVKQKFGPAAMRRAANYWLEAVEAKPAPATLSARDWRNITIHAASRLACESIL